MQLASSQQFDHSAGSLQEAIRTPKLRIQACQFLNCSAGTAGGGVSYVGAIANISSSEFMSCVSGGPGGGAACADSVSALDNLSFWGNVAADGGGGLHFSSSGTALEHVPLFADQLSEGQESCGNGNGNVAGFGDCFASSPWKLRVRRILGAEVQSEESSVGQPGVEMRFLVTMLDYYGNHLVSDSSSRIEVKIASTQKPNISVVAKTETMAFGSVEIAVDVFFTFANITARDWQSAPSEMFPDGAVFLAPARAQEICFVALLRSGDESIAACHALFMRGGGAVCPAGHVFSTSQALLGGCKACPEGKYSINPVFSPHGRRWQFQHDLAVFQSFCLPCECSDTT